MVVNCHKFYFENFPTKYNIAIERQTARPDQTTIIKCVGWRRRRRRKMFDVGITMLALL